jgi:hypothetical protein
MREKRVFFLLNAACAMQILHLISRVHHLLHLKETGAPTVCGNPSDTSAQQLVGNTSDSDILNLVAS